MQLRWSSLFRRTTYFLSLAVLSCAPSRTTMSYLLSSMSSSVRLKGISDMNIIIIIVVMTAHSRVILIIWIIYPFDISIIAVTSHQAQQLYQLISQIMNVNIQRSSSEYNDERSYSIMTDTFSYSSRQHLKKTFKDPITCYNLIIKCYNHDVNRIEDKYLSVMEYNKLVTFIDPYLSEPLGYLVLISIFVLLPLLNIIFYVLILVAMAKIIENEDCHRNNLELVPDPFHRMIYAEHLCETLSKSHWFLEIKLDAVQGLSVNQSMMQSLIARADNNGVVKFMIYNRKFKMYFTGYLNVKHRYIGWVFGLGVLLVLQLIVASYILSQQ